MGEQASYQDQFGSKENILIEGQPGEKCAKLWYGNLPTKSPEKPDCRLRLKLRQVLTGASSNGMADRGHSPFRVEAKPQKANLLSHQDLKSSEPNVARPLSFHQPTEGRFSGQQSNVGPPMLKSRFARY